MVKTRIIESDKYYEALRLTNRNYLISNIFGTIVVVAISSFFEEPYFYFVLAGLFVLEMVLLSKFFKKVRKNLTLRKLELDVEEIRILSETGGKVEEVIPIEKGDKIGLMENYEVYEPGLREVWDMVFKRKYERSYIDVIKPEGARRIEFTADSHYMIIQLNKLIKIWREQGRVVAYK